MELIVQNLSCARGGVPVLQGVNFVLKAGNALILHGSNGSGKTTLLRTIAGLQPALSGTIQAPDDEIAYAAHADGVKATLSVAENLKFWAGVYGVGGIDAALDTFALRSLKNRTAQSLSAGQRRRLGLARLLVTGRSIWVLDEPTVSLDVESAALFADAVRAHLGHGGIAIIASHVDMGLDAEVLNISDFRATEFSGGAF